MSMALHTPTSCSDSRCGTLDTAVHRLRRRALPRRSWCRLEGGVAVVVLGLLGG